jgi:GNAT superfamily N-acetyltransferase
VIEKSIAGSINFGVYDGDRQVAYARAVTDLATFAWICDVYVDAGARGRGIGTWLMRAVVDHLSARGVHRLVLATKDAEAVYERVGFTRFSDQYPLMERDTR